MTSKTSQFSRSAFGAIGLIAGLGLAAQVVLTQPAHARSESRDVQHVEKVEKTKVETQKPEKQEKPEKPEKAHG